MAVALHTNVGLMHATMALFNAFCDRVPMLVIGATGPVDAAQRRPWIDWIHTAADQGALIRSYVKWDDQPASVAAALESLVARRRADAQHTRARPSTSASTPRCRRSRSRATPRCPTSRAIRPPPAAAGRRRSEVARARDARWQRARPLILIGRVSRDGEAWARARRARRAARRGVLTDLKVGAAFPSRAPRSIRPLPGTFLTDAGRRAARAPRMSCSRSTGSTSAARFEQAYGAEPVSPRSSRCSHDHVAAQRLEQGPFRARARRPRDRRRTPTCSSPRSASGSPRARRRDARMAAAGDAAEPDARAPERSGRSPIARATRIRARTRCARSSASASLPRARCRSAGTGERPAVARTRSTTSARTAAPASARARAWRSARRWRSPAASGSPSRCSATATS